jgi:hypothetical protein
MYHGHGRHSNFFEGWYFKFVDAAEEHVQAVIPGVFLATIERLLTRLCRCSMG